MEVKLETDVKLENNCSHQWNFLKREKICKKCDKSLNYLNDPLDTHIHIWAPLKKGLNICSLCGKTNFKFESKTHKTDFYDFEDDKIQKIEKIKNDLSDFDILQKKFIIIPDFKNRTTKSNFTICNDQLKETRYQMYIKKYPNGNKWLIDHPEVMENFVKFKDVIDEDEIEEEDEIIEEESEKEEEIIKKSEDEFEEESEEIIENEDEEESEEEIIENEDEEESEEEIIEEDNEDKEEIEIYDDYSDNE